MTCGYRPRRRTLITLPILPDRRWQSGEFYDRVISSRRSAVFSWVGKATMLELGIGDLCFFPGVSADGSGSVRAHYRIRAGHDPTVRRSALESGLFRSRAVASPPRKIDVAAVPRTSVPHYSLIPGQSCSSILWQNRTERTSSPAVLHNSRRRRRAARPLPPPRRAHLSGLLTAPRASESTVN